MYVKVYLSGDFLAAYLLFNKQFSASTADIPWQFRLQIAKLEFHLKMISGWHLEKHIYSRLLVTNTN